MEYIVPTYQELNRYAQWPFDADQIYKMELTVLKTLKWNLITFTPLHFAGYYVSKGILFMRDKVKGRVLSKKVPKYLLRYIDFFADLTLQYYTFQEYPPSLLAAGIIMASRRAMSILPLWRKEFENLMKYSENEIKPCFEAVWLCYSKNFPEAASKAASGENIIT